MQARKRFGQNFLIDKSVAAAIVDEALAAQGMGHPVAVEIGPGRGALTELLAASLKEPLQCVEIDRDVIAYLKTRPYADRIVIHGQDALSFDFLSLAREGRKLNIVGNLPYNISTPLLFRLFAVSDAVASMVFMLQKEIVDRICAPPGDAHRGRLSVAAESLFDAEKLLEVPPEAFRPAPKVRSAVVRLTPKEGGPRAQDRDLMAALVAKAFLARRKTVRNALKGEAGEEEFKAAGIDPESRPQDLSAKQFVELADAVLRRRASSGEAGRG